MESKLNFDDYWNRIKSLLEEKGVSQAQFCRELGFDEQVYRNRKTTKTYPSIQDIVKIADYFDTTIDYLLTGAVKNPYIKRANELEQKFAQIKQILS